ncbi:unnamed protein product [Thelazia callipaeda]|uniref:Glyco_18 domain-containing protein n=1 Tax=Thelazia callipaeda TaxID=103827 RepID=A0A0N5CPK2_THECL|nr:unnamed protein product [Thelazia callipaeda]
MNECFCTLQKVAQYSVKRREFAQSTIDFLRQNNFDGMVLQWDYPVELSLEHSALVRALIKAFANENQSNNKNRLIFTVAGSVKKQSIDASYAAIDASYAANSFNKNTDLLFLLAYDFHNGLEQTTDLPSKLYSSQKDAVDNVAFAANYWVSKGMPKDKIVIGLSGFATGWTLADASQANIGARASGPSPPLAEGNSEGGKTAYWKICDYLNANAKETVDKEHVGAYLTEGNRWYGYDNPETIKIKVKWLKEQGFAGAFLSSLDADDFRGTSCGVGVYPLLTTIKKALETDDQQGTEYSTVTTTLLPTTSQIDLTVASQINTSDNEGKHVQDGTDRKHNHVRACYFDGSAQNILGSSGSLAVSDIPAGLCTHILYSSASIDEEGKSM